MTKSIIASLLALVSFTSTAGTIQYDTWTKATRGDSLTVLNVDKESDILSVNCQGGEYTWISLETDAGSVVYPDPDRTTDDTVTIELLVMTHSGEYVRWTQDDLNFDKGDGAGAQRARVLFDTLHTAKKVEVILNGDTIVPFTGEPSKAFPAFKDVAQYCKSK